MNGSTTKGQECTQHNGFAHSQHHRNRSHACIASRLMELRNRYKQIVAATQQRCKLTTASTAPSKSTRKTRRSKTKKKLFIKNPSTFVTKHTASHHIALANTAPPGPSTKRRSLTMHHGFSSLLSCFHVPTSLMFPPH